MTTKKAATRRFLNKQEACRRFPAHKVEDLDAHILKTDSLADRVVDGFAQLPGGRGWKLLEQALVSGIDAVPDAPPELVALFEHVDHVPDWVDWDQLERGAIAYWRSGFFTGLALQCASLAAGYQSSSAIMPLIITGRLVARAERRKQETGRWVLQASRPGGMRRFEQGFAYTVRVRLVHAFVRRKLMQMPEWDYQAWGAPINLTDTSYGICGEFSSVAIDAIEKCGVLYSDQERADIYALWRYVGHVLGIPHRLLPVDEEDALERMAIKELTDTRADDNSRELVRGLIEHGGDDIDEMPRLLRTIITQERLIGFLYGQVRYFAGDSLADELGAPDTAYKHILRLSKPLVRFFDTRRQRSEDREKAERFLTLGWRMLDDKAASAELASEESLSRDIAKRRSLLRRNLRPRAA